MNVNEFAIAVARFNANSDRANLNCNRNPTDSNDRLGITQGSRALTMKTYRKQYEKLCSYENLYLAYQKARKEKTKKQYVLDFEAHLEGNLIRLQKELQTFDYKPNKLKKFIVRDPKTRTIHASAFRDRVVHHALVNILEPIFERIFIQDSYASRKNRGTHLAVNRFIYFIRKVSSNGRFVKGAWNRNSVCGYVLKADIKKYFDYVDHKILLGIIRRKVRDEGVLWLVKVILDNFETSKEEKDMPLGNYTSQFFANVYLNELDYFVKHVLKAKYYIRYVDDFVILHRRKKMLEHYKDRITRYLACLEITIHPDKSDILPLRNGITFLGYRIFYHYRLLRKRNIKHFKKEFEGYLELYKEGFVTKKMLLEQLQGWFGYAQWANTYNLRQQVLKYLESGGGERT